MQLSERVLGDNARRKLSLKDNVGYSIGTLGPSIVFSMISLYMMNFYTDVMKISGNIFAILLFVTLLSDVICIPFIGILVDKTITRWGKFRPYMIFFTMPSVIFFMLTFWVPPYGYDGKVVWIFITFTLLSMITRFIEIPYNGMAARITNNSLERAEIGMITRIMATVAMIIIATFTMPIVGRFENKQDGYFYSALLFGIIMLISYVITIVATKKYDTSDTMAGMNARTVNAGMKTNMIFIMRNRPLIVLLGGFFFIQLGTVIMSLTAIYFFKYYIKDIGFYPSYMGFYLLMAIAGTFISPAMVKKFGKKKTLQISNVIVLAIYGVTYAMISVMNCESVSRSFHYGPLFFVTMIGSFFNGPVFAMIWGMMPDTVEYAEWKTDKRAEGLIYSSFALTTRIGLGLGGVISGIFIGLIDYVPNVQQSQTTLFYILVLHIMLPFVCRIVTSMIIGLYHLDEDLFESIKIKISEKKLSTEGGEA